MARFEPTIIFCSVGGDDDHYTTPPGQIIKFLSTVQLKADLLQESLLLVGEYKELKKAESFFFISDSTFLSRR
jgi:hypothetical protein